MIEVRTKRNDPATAIGKLNLGDTKVYIQFAVVGQRNFEKGRRLFQELNA